MMSVLSIWASQPLLYFLSLLFALVLAFVIDGTVPSDLQTTPCVGSLLFSSRRYLSSCFWVWSLVSGLWSSVLYNHPHPVHCYSHTYPLLLLSGEITPHPGRRFVIPDDVMQTDPFSVPFLFFSFLFSPFIHATLLFTLFPYTKKVTFTLYAMILTPSFFFSLC